MFDASSFVYYYAAVKARKAQEVQQAKEEAGKLRAMTPEEQSAYLSAKKQAENEELRLREVQALERIADLLANPRAQEIKLDHKFF